MKILHITATHLGRCGGIPAVLKELVCAQNNIPGCSSIVLSLRADATSVNNDSFISLTKNQFENFVESFRPDVAIFHSHFYFEYSWYGSVLFERGIPYFIEPHGSFGKRALKHSFFKKLIANHVLLRRFMLNAAGYIFLNEEERLTSAFHKKNELVIPNGVCPRELDRKIDTSGDVQLYFIGRYDVNHKGLKLLFRALKILDKEGFGVRFNLFGSGTTKEVLYVHRMIKGLANMRVKDCGPIYGESQFLELEKSGIMVLLSKYEGFPMTVLEALNYGNPCLVTTGTNVAGMIVENSLGWCVSYNPADVATAIRHAVDSYLDNRALYISRCNDFVCKNFAWNDIARSSLKQIDSFLRKRRQETSTEERV